VTDIIFKELSYAIIGAAMEVHRILGPGFLEAVYQKALAHELTLRGIRFEQFKKLPVYYKGILVGEYEADFVIEGKIILEIKAISKLHPRHRSPGHQLPDRHRLPPGDPAQLRRHLPRTPAYGEVEFLPRISRITTN